MSNREKLIKEKRIQEANLISLKKKLNLDLQLKKKDLDKVRAVKETSVESYDQKAKELAQRQAELLALQAALAELLVSQQSPNISMIVKAHSDSRENPMTQLNDDGLEEDELVNPHTATVS